MKTNNEKGQFVIELVLILTFVAALSSVLISHLKSYDLPRKIAAEPWQKLDGMVQCGVWQACGIGVKNPAGLHPTHEARRVSLKITE